MNLIKISRPSLWIIGPLVFLLGMKSAHASFMPLAIFQLIFLSFPYCLFLYGINDVYDYASDALNPRKTLKLHKKDHQFIKHMAGGIVVVLIISSAATLSLRNILGTAILLFFSYYYSAPPLRLKEMPPLDSFSNGMLYFFGPFMMGAGFGQQPLPVALIAITACVMGIHAFSTICDYTPDKAAGDRTFAIVFGKRVAALAALAVFLASILYADLSLVIRSYLLFCSAFFLLSAIYPDEKLALAFGKAIFVGFVMAALMVL